VLPANGEARADVGAVLERDIRTCVSMRVHVLPVMVQSLDGFGRWAARRGLGWRGERVPRVVFLVGLGSGHRCCTRLCQKEGGPAM
jgi:hypothetical protein